MLLWHLFEDEVADLKAAYVRLKSKRDQLAADVKDVPFPASEPDPRAPVRLTLVHSEEEYQRKRKYHERMRSLISHRIIDMNHELAVLKAQMIAAKRKGTPNEIFTSYDSQKTKYERHYLSELGQMVDQADASLPYPAADAITTFVGHGYSRNPEEGAAGFWTQERLEDAYSAHPSERGREIRHQLEVAFAPIRQALKRQYGDTITIHRAQQPLKGTEKPRNVLSWTSNLTFAKSLADDSYDIMTKDVPIDDIIWITDRANQSEFIIRTETSRHAVTT